VNGSVGTALASTRLLSAARLRTLRTTCDRAVFMLGVLAICFGVLIASNGGTLVMALAADQSSDSPTRDLARQVLIALARDDLATFTTVVLACVTVCAVAVPASTRTPATLIPHEHRVWLPVSSMSKYFESGVLSLLTLLTFTQLLTLTFLASLASLEGTSRSSAMVVAWTTWLVLVVAANTLTWVLALLRARCPIPGPVLRAGSVAIIGTLVVVVALTWDQATTLWGISQVYIDATRADLPLAAWGAGVVLVTGVLAVIGWFAARATPVRSDGARTSGDVVARDVRGGAYGALTTVLWRSAARSAAVRNQPVMIVVLLTAVAALTGPDDRVVWGSALVVPLVVSLSFTRNFLAVMGPANLWLGSLRTGMVHLPWAGASVGWTASVVGCALIWTIPAATGRMGALEIVQVASACLASASLMSATSVLYAIRNPRPLAGAGDPLLPVGATVTSTLRLIVGPGLISWIATSGIQALHAADDQGGPTTWTFLPTAACLLLAACVMTLASSHWARPHRRSAALVGAL